MRKVLRIDENGFFIEDVLIDGETPIDCIDTPCPEGFYKPKWDGETWVEGLTQEEIDAIPVPVDLKAQAIEEINAATTISALKAAMLKYVEGVE